MYRFQPDFYASDVKNTTRAPKGMKLALSAPEKKEFFKLVAKKQDRSMTPAEQKRFLELGAKDFSARFLQDMKALSRG